MNICEDTRTFFLGMLNKADDYQATLKFMCTATVPRTLFLSKYKSLLPIEEQPAEEKKEWKVFVNEIFPGTPPIFRLEAVKIIYCIGILTN